MKRYTWFVGLLLLCFSCGEETGTCSTTCFSKSTGQNLGTNTYPNYTRKECEELLENRQTSLTDCFLEFEKD